MSNLKVEKTVFISYRRTNIYHAIAVFQDLRKHRYDVFMDYKSMDSGAFDQIILNQVRARAHFLVLLTPSALERCANPGDWLRREIETAIDHKRNIVPLMFDGFDFNSMSQYLTGKLSVLSNYHALTINAQFFDAAMKQLRKLHLNIALDVVLHPTLPADVSEVSQRINITISQPPPTKKQLNANEYFERAHQHVEQGHYDQGIKDYTECIRLDPQYVVAYHNRGIAYRKKGDINQAINNYNKAIQLNGQYADAYNSRGVAYHNKGDYDQAIRDYDTALDIDPNHTLARKNRELAIQARSQKK